MSLLSISKIAELTGMSTRTVRKRLDDLTPIPQGKALTFEAKEAFPLLFDAEKSTSDFCLEAERARLAARQAEKVELELAERRAELIPFDLAEQTIGAAFAEIRAGILGQHNMIASEFPEIPTDAIRRILSANRELLARLAETELPRAIQGALEALDVEACASAGSHGEPVGG